MAQSHDWRLQSASLIWILTLLLSESQSKKTQTYFMQDGGDCGKTKNVGGATVYSHFEPHINAKYGHDAGCTMTFRAENEGWTLMLWVVELDLPNKSETGLCNDALYVYDADSYYTRAVKEAGGNGGLCGNSPPPVLFSTGAYFTVHFRSDAHGPLGRGFRFIITAISDDFEKNGSCGSSFQCDNNWCIDEDLVCDKIDHCGDKSDEAEEGKSKCGTGEGGLINKFLSLGVTASVAITVGSIVVAIVCVIAVICCCRKSMCKKQPETPSVTTTATTVVSNGTTRPYQAPQTSNLAAHYSQHGYYPMQSAYPSPHGSTYTPLPQKELYTHSHSGYSSQPPSYHRSYTPTSSKSGKSNRSTNSVTFSQGTEKVSLPINL